MENKTLHHFSAKISFSLHKPMCTKGLTITFNQSTVAVASLGIINQDGISISIWKPKSQKHPVHWLLFFQKNINRGQDVKWQKIALEDCTVVLLLKIIAMRMHKRLN